MIKIMKEKVRDQESEAGIAAALAHEAAHIYQFRTRINHGSLWDALLALDNNMTRRRAELHADFMSGWCLGSLDARIFDSSGVDIAARKLYSLGAFTPGDPNDHGTPEQRYSCFLRGFFSGRNDKVSVDLASTGGSDFVNAIVPMLPEP